MSETLTAEQRLIQAVLRWDELEMIGTASDPSLCACDNCTALRGRYARQIQEPVKCTVRALAECGLSKRAIARQVGIDRRSVGRILAAT